MLRGEHFLSHTLVSLTTYKDFPVKTVAAGAKELETLLITDQTGLEEKAPVYVYIGA